MKYDVDYFLNKFKAIPHSRWITGEFSDDKCRHCALGHCGYTTKERTEEGAALLRLVEPATHSSIVTINDYKYKHYKTPKGRIMAALRDVKKLQQGSK